MRLPPEQVPRRGSASIEFRDAEELVAITIADMTSHAGGPLPETRRVIDPFTVEGATEHMLLGSVTEKVVRTSPCPVLTVRKSG